MLQVILVLRLGLPERPRRLHLGDDLAGPKTGRLDVGDRVLGDPALSVVGSWIWKKNASKSRNDVSPGSNVISIASACVPWLR